ncbi:hypothetical protein GGR92_001297 [Spirosoma lacussanchae]|uniref:ABC transporter permease n=1 Tax=Spirosoma lacussanchae TaxID=1884249 RepID=UPI001FE82EBE|nr:ABC transporter permease [Spirosoma lacussanchae]
MSFSSTLIRFSVLTITLLTLSVAALAQTSYDIAPGEPAVFNGVEYGIEVLNERAQDVKTEEYNRYELGLYVTNKSGCAKLIFPRQTLFGTESNPNLLASFDCLNATGKRMTSKGGSLLARPFVVPYRETVKGADGKDVVKTTNVQAGYILRNGESVSDRIIVIVPAGEKPRMRVRVREIIDNF